MDYSFVKGLVGSPWMIEPATLNSLYPVYRGLLNGLQAEKGDEPTSHRPYFLSAATGEICSHGTPGAGADGEEPDEAPSREKVVNVVPVRGILLKHDQECGPKGTRTLANRLLGADGEENVIGHILVVESAGGLAMAVAEMTEAAQKCKKPIVAWVDGMAASAAYYIACYSREIVASREFDSVGCIGTMVKFEGRKAKSAENGEGEVSVTIYADGSEEKNEEFESAINGFNFTLMKERLLNPLNEKFRADVKAQRPQVLEEQLKGRTFFAKDVVGTLVDSIGGFQVAVERVLALANFGNQQAQGQNTSGTNSTNQINSKIDMKQFPHLNNALGVDELASTDEGAFLNEGQLAFVEERLEAIPQLVAEREAATLERDGATAALETARATIASAYAPFDVIDPAIAAAKTPEEKAAAMRLLLSKRPVVAPVQNLGTQDGGAIDTEVDWEAINNLPHNKLVDLNS